MRAHLVERYTDRRIDPDTISGYRRAAIPGPDGIPGPTIPAEVALAEIVRDRPTRRHGVEACVDGIWSAVDARRPTRDELAGAIDYSRYEHRDRVLDARASSAAVDDALVVHQLISDYGQGDE